MLQRIGARVRDRIDPVDIGISLAVAGLLSISGFSANPIALLLALVVVTPVGETVLERLEPAPGLAWAAFGVAWLAAGAAQLRATEPRLGVALLAIGSWICLDGLYGWRRGGSNDGSAREPDSDESEDPSRAEVFRISRHNRRLVETLRTADRPLTEAELRSRTGLSAAELERALSAHDRGESGPIDRVGNGYVLDESDTGLVAMTRAAVGTVVGRLLRPLRLLRPSG